MLRAMWAELSLADGAGGCQPSFFLQTSSQSSTFWTGGCIRDGQNHLLPSRKAFIYRSLPLGTMNFNVFPWLWQGVANMGSLWQFLALAANLKKHQPLFQVKGGMTKHSTYQSKQDHCPT